jgi:hypothetical protein
MCKLSFINLVNRILLFFLSCFLSFHISLQTVYVFLLARSYMCKFMPTLLQMRVPIHRIQILSQYSHIQSQCMQIQL